MIIARRLLIAGLVQGVGYRYFAQRSAARHQVTGFAKNLTDGRVEVFVQGVTPAVEAFKHDLMAGPTYSKVNEVEEIVADINRSFSTFRIER